MGAGLLERVAVLMAKRTWSSRVHVGVEARSPPSTSIRYSASAPKSYTPLVWVRSWLP